MRMYIFTEDEIRCIIEWVLQNKETASTRQILTRIRQSMDRLSLDVELLVLVLRKMRQEDVVR